MPGGLFGGLFSKALAVVLGPGDHPLARFRRARPVSFAVLCGLVAAAFAVISGGLTFGAGYGEAKVLLTDHPGGGLSFALCKFGASLAAAVAALRAASSHPRSPLAPGSGPPSPGSAWASRGAMRWCWAWPAISLASCRRP
jgi:hypothetical protein